MTRYYHYYRPGRPGWSRRWANVRLGLTVVGQAAFLAGLFIGVPLVVVVIAAATDRLP